MILSHSLIFNGEMSISGDRVERPIVTYCLLLLMLSVMLILHTIGKSFVDQIIQIFSLVPYMVLQGEHIHTLITYMFLHGDLTHFILNALALFGSGVAVERDIGSKNFFIIS